MLKWKAPDFRDTDCLPFFGRISINKKGFINFKQNRCNKTPFAKYFFQYCSLTIKISGLFKIRFPVIGTV